MAAEAQARPLFARPSLLTNLKQIFLPIGQLLVFIIGCTLILGAIVIAIGFIMSTRD